MSMTRRVGRGSTSKEERDDADLIADIRASDADAMSVLFHRYVRLVYRVAADILRDDGEAEDVTQDVFLEIYRKAYLYDSSRGPVRGWLLQYAYHRSLRRKQALRRRAAYVGEPLEEAETMTTAARPALTRQECRWILRRGMAQLPANQRATLELACFEDASLRDVAVQLQVSFGCARHYYYRGLARLREWAAASDVSMERSEETRHRRSPRRSIDELFVRRTLEIPASRETGPAEVDS